MDRRLVFRNWREGSWPWGSRFGRDGERSTRICHRDHILRRV